MAALFVFDVVVMLVLGQFLKREPYEESKENKEGVDLTNWEHARVTVASLVLGLISLHVLLSPLGLASTEGQPLLILGIYAILQVIFLFVFRSKKEV
ncbi:hypothetical protein ACBR35_03565 [Pasteurella multocida]